MVVQNIDFTTDSIAAVTNPAEGIALAQKEAVNIEWSLVILEGTRTPTVLRMEGQEILLTKILKRNRASMCRRLNWRQM
jgi:hypothetical protein